MVCDSVGCGGAPDAAGFGDEDANTLGHVIAAADPALPNLARLGLGSIPGVPPLDGGLEPAAAHGRLTERGPGKDTMLGHWELMGIVSDNALPLYPDGFPEQVIESFVEATGHGVIGNRPASGTVIIEELGERHVRTGALIVYTSGDSVFQVAAHEAVVSPDELYAICRRARALLRGKHAVGRVIARPFVDDPTRGFRRTAGRKDFPLPPPRETALDHLAAAGIGVAAVGKIDDIFTGRGIQRAHESRDNAEGMTLTHAAIESTDEPFVFTNLVDFDSEYGHRNDPGGYAAALEEFDRGLPALLEALPEDGCLILTADHGNDPTTPGTDHTRERVPLLCAGPAVAPNDLGIRDFADLGATVLDNFGVEVEVDGTSFLDQL